MILSVIARANSVPAGGELSEFTDHCEELGIQHIVASKRRPTTTGKIEVFHKAYVNEAHLFIRHWAFVRYYNYTRPHDALNYLTPATIYFRLRFFSFYLTVAFSG
jgi:hypothetical protein